MMARKLISMAALAASVAAAVVPSVAMAQDYDRSGWDQGRDYADNGRYQDQRDWRDSSQDNQRREWRGRQGRTGYDRAYGNDGYYARSGYGPDRVYRGSNGYYHHKCGGGDGAVGTIAGGAGGAVIGSVAGGGTLGTLLGGLGGALLGRTLDKQHSRDRNGC